MVGAVCTAAPLVRWIDGLVDAWFHEWVDGWMDGLFGWLVDEYCRRCKDCVTALLLLYVFVAVAIAAADGITFWGSPDGYVYAVSAQGDEVVRDVCVSPVGRHRFACTHNYSYATHAAVP
jgi:hypothetical protein